MIKGCYVLFLVFFRVYRPNIVIDIVIMVHQLLKPPLLQTPRPTQA